MPKASRFGKVDVLWAAFLAVWAGSLLLWGSVTWWAAAGVASALAVLNVTAQIFLPGQLRLSRPAIGFLLCAYAVFAVQLLPIGGLFHYTQALRARLDLPSFAPATASTFLTLRAFLKAAAFALSALLVLRLLSAGLRRSRILAGVCLILLLEAAYGLVQVGAGLKNLPFYGPRLVLDMSGTFVSPNAFAGLLAIGLAACAGLALSNFVRFPGPRRIERMAPWALLAALLVVCTVLSLSRGGAIAAATGLFIVPFLYHGRAGLAGSLILLLLGTLAVLLADPSRLAEDISRVDPFHVTAQARWRYWSAALDGWTRQPVLGFGIGTFAEAFRPFQPPDVPGFVNYAHSEYVGALFEGGVLWVLVLLGGLSIWLVRSVRSLPKLRSHERAIVAGAIGGVIAFLVHSIVDCDLQMTSTGMLLAVLIAVASPPGPGRERPWIERSLAGSAVVAGAAIVFGGVASVPLVEEAMESPPARAERLCRRALRYSPYDFRAAWIWAVAADRLGAHATADRRYEAAADLWPAHADLQREAGLYFWEGYVSTGDPGYLERARKTLHRMFVASPGRIIPVLREVRRIGRSAEALVLGNPAAVAGLAVVMTEDGEWKKALALFDRGCPAEPENAPAFDLFANGLRRIGQWGIEAEIRDRRLRIRADAAAYAAAARAWARLGAYDRALERLAFAMRLDPANPEWAAFRARLLWKAGRRLDALEAWSGVIEMAPLNAGYRLERARAYAAMGLDNDAAADFQDVLRLQPRHREGTLGLAGAWLRLGLRADAAALLQRWLEAHPDDAEARRLLKKTER